ncbi:MAG: hypothetical protein NTW50_03990 [Candidatus Berkelbacteria bacterium]|nr:hypothetical protein [Candidatus Berkelbacteria bacterium]
MGTETLEESQPQASSLLKLEKLISNSGGEGIVKNDGTAVGRYSEEQLNEFYSLLNNYDRRTDVNLCKLKWTKVKDCEKVYKEVLNAWLTECLRSKGAFETQQGEIKTAQAEREAELKADATKAKKDLPAIIKKLGADQAKYKSLTVPGISEDEMVALMGQESATSGNVVQQMVEWLARLGLGLVLGLSIGLLVEALNQYRPVSVMLIPFWLVGFLILTINGIVIKYLSRESVVKDLQHKAEMDPNFDRRRINQQHKIVDSACNGHSQVQSDDGKEAVATVRDESGYQNWWQVGIVIAFTSFLTIDVVLGSHGLFRALHHSKQNLPEWVVYVLAAAVIYGYLWMEFAYGHKEGKMGYLRSNANAIAASTADFKLEDRRKLVRQISMNETKKADCEAKIAAYDQFLAAKTKTANVAPKVIDFESNQPKRVRAEGNRLAAALKDAEDTTEQAINSLREKLEADARKLEKSFWQKLTDWFFEPSID